MQDTCSLPPWSSQICAYSKVSPDSAWRPHSAGMEPQSPAGQVWKLAGFQLGQSVRQHFMALVSYRVLDRAVASLEGGREIPSPKVCLERLEAVPRCPGVFKEKSRK